MFEWVGGLIKPIADWVLRARDESREADKRLFAKFLEALPSNGVILFVRDHDFGVKFVHKQVFPIYDFPVKWDNAEHEFKDSLLESLRIELLELAREFGDEIATNTFPYGLDHQGLSDMWPREKVEAARERLNDLGTKFVAAHQEFVRTAKERLSV